MYLHEGKTQTEIAQILNVERKTVYNWIQKGKWIEMKIANQQAPAAVLREMYNHIGEINKNELKIKNSLSGEENLPAGRQVGRKREAVGEKRGNNETNTKR